MTAYMLFFYKKISINERILNPLGDYENINYYIYQNIEFYIFSHNKKSNFMYYQST